MSNTGVRVYTQNEYRADDQDWIAASKYIATLVTKGYLDNCYVNGKLIKSKEDRRLDAAVLASKNNKYKTDRINKALDLIENQSKAKGGRQVDPKDASKTSFKNFPSASVLVVSGLI